MAEINELSAIALEPSALENNAQTTNKESKDSVAQKSLYVPHLVEFIGCDLEEAIDRIGSGASVVSLTQSNQNGSAVRSQVVVALSNESADASSGTPSVTLALNEDGQVIQAGFRVNMRLLGYGSISFIDAANNMHVIENALNEAGLAVETGSVVLPDTKAEYAVYGPDGITLDREECSFSGTGQSGDATYEWEGELVYDYSAANTAGNLAYTVRTVAVNVIAER